MWRAANVRRHISGGTQLAGLSWPFKSTNQISDGLRPGPSSDCYPPSRSGELSAADRSIQCVRGDSSETKFWNPGKGSSTGGTVHQERCNLCLDIGLICEGVHQWLAEGAEVRRSFPVLLLTLT